MDGLSGASRRGVGPFSAPIAGGPAPAPAPGAAVRAADLVPSPGTGPQRLAGLPAAGTRLGGLTRPATAEEVARVAPPLSGPKRAQ